MSTVTLTANLSDLVGRPVQGAELWIAAPAIAYDGDLYAGGLTKVGFDSRGRVVVDLLATDTEGTDPDEWQYCFSVRWTGGALRKFYTTLTEDSDLADLIPLDPTQPEYLPVYVPVEGPQGEDGPQGEPGLDGSKEVGYAEIQTSHVSTPAAGYDFSQPIPGLLSVVVGEGRPVEIEAFFPGVFASGAYADLFPYISVNGGVENAGVTVASRSAVTTDGPAVLLKRRLVLQAGVTYTFRAGVALSSPGPSVTALASTYQPAYLSVVSR